LKFITWNIRGVGSQTNKKNKKSFKLPKKYTSGYVAKNYLKLLGLVRSQ